MILRVHLFSLLRQQVGADFFEVVSDGPLALAEVLRRAELDGVDFGTWVWDDPARTRLRKGVLLLVNGRNSVFLEGLETVVDACSVIHLFPPGGGG